MKIVILVGGLPPLYNGGTEIATVKIAEYAAKAGHDVHIIAADGTGRGESLYKRQEKGFTIHRVATIPPHYLHGLSFVPGSVKKIIDLKPDIIHAQAAYVALSAYIASKLTGIPYILYDRGGIYINWMLKNQLTKLFMRNASRVIAQTEHMKKEMLKYYDREIEVIPNGIDIDRFNVSRSLCSIKRVLIVGRLRPEKNVGCFVKAMKYVKAVGVVAGDGPQLELLKKMGNGQEIVFFGLVKNEDIPMLMASSDVLVNTSLSEGFPVAILEGMASGLPIVAPRVCGIPEIVEDGVNGILTEPNNPKSTAGAINRILNDEKLASSMSQNNKKKAREYTWEAVVKKLYN